VAITDARNSFVLHGMTLLLSAARVSFIEPPMFCVLFLKGQMVTS
jgi:hypothetical protein